MMKKIQFMFPELNENQYNMLERLIEDIIGKDEIPINSADEETFAQNDLRKLQRAKLKELMEG